MSERVRASRTVNGHGRPLELWGGLECTVNRVGDCWFDQTPRSGHEDRASDLELFADLGITSLRYPALWEKISPASPEERDFRWTDARLPRIRDLGMDPIITLCHHGSGPHWTHLMDDGFAPGLARHAAAVAERYPWLRQWTPVNEPLTTARFSGLYGYWYPHTHSEEAMWLALLNEIDATRLSMREIRRVNPNATLVQTDDLGYCHATPPLQCEADFQNERRWMGWDLLCGRVGPGHPLWDRLQRMGFGDRLRAIADDPCPPDVIGVNHYLASERLLDHRVDRHLDRAVADRQVARCAGVDHVDVDAIRSLKSGVLGLPALLRQAAERYGRPVAVTECHNGATREEQVRWFVDVWEGAEALRQDGIDIRSVTAWSLLGSHDWNRMVTRSIGHYEVGVFDIRSGTPRPTMLAGVLKDLAAGRAPDAIGLGEPGWWRRPSRFRDVPPAPTGAYDLGQRGRAGAGPRPLLIIGHEGPLTRLLVRACEVRSLHYRRSTEVTETVIRWADPWAVVDTRDWAGVCEAPWRTGLPHFDPPETLATLCGRLELPCAAFTAHEGLEEIDDALVSLSGGRMLLGRTHRVFTPWDRTQFPVRALDALDAGLPLHVEDGLWDGAYGPDVADAVLDLLMDGVTGPVALTAPDTWSLADFASHLAHTADCDPELVALGAAEAAAEALAPRSYLLPGETMLERFVRESRCARRHGEIGVTHRRDDTHLQAAE